MFLVVVYVINYALFRRFQSENMRFKDTSDFQLRNKIIVAEKVSPFWARVGSFVGCLRCGTDVVNSSDT